MHKWGKIAFSGDFSSEVARPSSFSEVAYPDLVGIKLGKPPRKGVLKPLAADRKAALARRI